MSYSAYLFDFDYTLVNSETGIMICYRTVLRRHGHPDVPDEVIKRGIGRPLPVIFSELTGIRDDAVLDEYAREYVAEGDKYMEENTFLFPSVIPVLSELKRRGKMIGIISTKYRFRIMETIEKHGIASLFDIVVGGDDVKNYKPDPEGVLLAAKTLGVGPDDILYIGDSLIDAGTAQNAGVDFAAVTTGVTTQDEFAPYPRVMIADSLGALL